jgi:excisionase family DNA binding protein
VKRLSYTEAAVYIGVSVRTLRVMVHRKTVPHIRLAPRLVVFDLAQLDAWLAANSVAVGGGR